MQLSGAPNTHHEGRLLAHVRYCFCKCEISGLRPGMRGERFCVDAKYDARGKAAGRKEAMNRQGDEKAGCINRRIPPGRPVLMCSFRDIRLVGEYRFTFGRTTAHPALFEVLSEYFSDTSVA